MTKIFGYFNRENADKIASALSSRAFLFVTVLILAVLLLRQCGETKSAEIEARRNFNNYLASEDSIRIISTERDGLLVETSAFEKTVRELRKENSDLLSDLRFERSKPPKIVIRTIIEYRDTAYGNTNNNFSLSDSTGVVSFSYEPELIGRNYLKINAEIPYMINPKETPPVSFDRYSISISQIMDIRAGLYRDPKDKRLYYRFFTDFPNVVLQEAQVVNVTDDPDTRKALRSARKEFGVGVNVGYGLGFSTSGYSIGPYIGIGVSYNPRFLQFGK